MNTVLPLEVMKHLPRQRGWTRAEFERVDELGLFADEKLELIEGVIVEKTTQNSPHVIVIYRAQEAVEAVFPKDSFMVRAQAPLALSDNSLPEPDIAVVEGNWRQWTQQHPQTALLVIEVSDSTLDTDRSVKASLYARAGIADYWIINVQDRVLEVHREPAPMTGEALGFGYRSVQRFTAEQSIAPLTAPQNLISIADLLP